MRTWILSSKDFKGGELPNKSQNPIILFTLAFKCTFYIQSIKAYGNCVFLKSSLSEIPLDPHNAEKLHREPYDELL
jgi:hypothetical protein